MGGARGNEAAGHARGESNRFASISREQKTRIHSILVRDTAIHRYHRGDVNFPFRLEPGSLPPSSFLIRPRRSCRSIRSSRATRSWCSTT